MQSPSNGHDTRSKRPLRVATDSTQSPRTLELPQLSEAADNQHQPDTWPGRVRRRTKHSMRRGHVAILPLDTCLRARPTFTPI